MKKKIIVLAGNLREFLLYIRKKPKGWNVMIYGDNKETLAGIIAKRVEIIGTFDYRKDADKLLDFATARIK